MFFDKIMVNNFVLFVNAIVSLAIQMKYHTINKNDIQAKKINNIMRLFIPVIIVIGLIFIVAGL